MNLELEAKVVFVNLSKFSLLLPQREHVPSIQHRISVFVYRQRCAHEAAARWWWRSWRTIGFRHVACRIVVDAGFGQRGAVVKLVAGLQDRRCLDTLLKQTAIRIPVFHVV
ncbi:hypothetical protein BKA81DRAFT_365472, partial [Phyllosticta paracitricarpa]